MPLTLVITDVGLAALVNAQNTGTLPLVLSEVALGTGLWLPTSAATALQAEIKRIATVGGSAVADNTLHVTITDDSADAYALGEVGLYTDGGVLFAIYSDLDGITAKAADAMLLEAWDIVFTALPPGSVTVGATGFNNPPASETVAGVAKIATQAQVDAGVDDTSFLTPAKAAARYQTLSSAYESAELALATAVSVAHGLGVTPAWVEAVIRCKVADLGYSVGDEVDASAVQNGSGQISIAVWGNSTNIGCALQSTSSIEILPKSGAVGAAQITGSSWVLVLRAHA